MRFVGIFDNLIFRTMIKFYLTYCTLFFCLYSPLVTAQSTPFFHFTRNVYTTQYPQDMLAKLKAFQAKLSPRKQLKIVQAMLKSQKLKRPVNYRPVIPKANQGQHSFPSFWVLDFDQDKTVDLIMLHNTYFGPSPGYFYYFNNKGKFEYVFDNAGDLFVIKQQNQHTVLQHVIPVIDLSETKVIQTFEYHHEKQAYTWAPKLYYASQTKLPPQLLKKPKLVSMHTNVAVRTNKVMDNKPLKQTKPSEVNEVKTTQTLRGNVVATYAAGAKAYVLANQGDWLFVAFVPHTSLLKTSLRHGMDEGYDPKTYKTTGPAIKPYICGWILKKSLK